MFKNLLSNVTTCYNLLGTLEINFKGLKTLAAFKAFICSAEDIPRYGRTLDLKK